MLRASLVKCMRSIADTYRHETLETALPEALFVSLVELMTVTQHGQWCLTMFTYCATVPFISKVSGFMIICKLNMIICKLNIFVRHSTGRLSAVAAAD